MTTVIVIAFVGLLWILPIYVAHQIGAPKHRAGFAWGLFLGWFGVLVVALLPARQNVRPAEPLLFIGKKH
jgi:hypothetical protein